MAIYITVDFSQYLYDYTINSITYLYFVFIFNIYSFKYTIIFILLVHGFSLCFSNVKL